MQFSIYLKLYLFLTQESKSRLIDNYTPNYIDSKMFRYKLKISRTTHVNALSGVFNELIRHFFFFFFFDFLSSAH